VARVDLLNAWPAFGLTPFHCDHAQITSANLTSSDTESQLVTCADWARNWVKLF